MAIVNIPEQYQTLKTRLERVVKKIISPKTISENEDLDNYTEVGMYYCPTASVATTLTKCPVTNAFSLFVEKTSGYENACTQTITSYNGSVMMKYVRVIQTYEGTFQDSGWLQIPLSSKEVPNGSNLNDYYNVGFYHNDTSANTTNIENLPGNKHIAFCLSVEDMGGKARKQTLTFQGTVPTIFMRERLWDGSWTSWFQIPTNVSSWASQKVGTYGTLYYNDALRLCDFNFYRTGFTPSTTEGVTIASGIIPSAYRPKNSVKLKFYNPKQGGVISTDGNLIGWFSSTSSQTVNCSGMWHY